MNAAPLAALVQYCEAFAKRMISTAGAFLPFGAFVNAQGRIEALGADPGATPPSAHESYELLHGATRQLAAEGRLVACAIATDVDIPARYEPAASDGIRIQVETPGYARHVYTPYRRLSWPGFASSWASFRPSTTGIRSLSTWHRTPFATPEPAGSRCRGSMPPGWRTRPRGPSGDRGRRAGRPFQATALPGRRTARTLPLRPPPQ